MRLTLALLILQALLFVTGLTSSNHSYFLWVLGGAGSTILVMIGAVVGLIALLFGIVVNNLNAKRCGVTLFFFNTLPLIMLIIAGHQLFGDQYNSRSADGQLKTMTVEQSVPGYPPQSVGSPEP